RAGALALMMAWSRSPRASGTMPSDRKSTRLNSSHVATSHAVFCLKKQKGGAPTPAGSVRRDVTATVSADQRAAIGDKVFFLWTRDPGDLDLFPTQALFT